MTELDEVALSIWERLTEEEKLRMLSFDYALKVARVMMVGESAGVISGVGEALHELAKDMNR